MGLQRWCHLLMMLMMIVKAFSAPSDAHYSLCSWRGWLQHFAAAIADKHMLSPLIQQVVHCESNASNWLIISNNNNNNNNIIHSCNTRSFSHACWWIHYLFIKLLWYTFTHYDPPQLPFISGRLLMTKVKNFVVDSVSDPNTTSQSSKSNLRLRNWSESILCLRNPLL